MTCYDVEIGQDRSCSEEALEGDSPKAETAVEASGALGFTRCERSEDFVQSLRNLEYIEDGPSPPIRQEQGLQSSRTMISVYVLPCT